MALASTDEAVVACGGVVEGGIALISGSGDEIWTIGTGDTGRFGTRRIGVEVGVAGGAGGGRT